LQQQRLQWRVARRHAARRARKSMWERGVQLSRTWRRATAGLSRWLPVDGSRCRCPSDSRCHHCGRRPRVAAAAPVAGRVLSVAANGCSGSVGGNAGVHDSNGSPLVPTFTLCTVGINSEADTVAARRQHAPQSALGLAPCLQVCSCFYARALPGHPPTYSQLACYGGDQQVARKEAAVHKQARREHKRSSLRHEQDVVPVSANRQGVGAWRETSQPESLASASIQMQIDAGRASSNTNDKDGLHNTWSITADCVAEQVTTRARSAAQAFHRVLQSMSRRDVCTFPRATARGRPLKVPAVLISSAAQAKPNVSPIPPAEPKF